MSWSRRSILLGALATGACGFSPAFGPGAPAARLQGAVQVSEPETRDAFLLTRQIEDRLGRAATPRYLLETDLAIWQERMGQSIPAEAKVLPVVPLFHVNAWGIPYASPLLGHSLVMPGAALDGPSLFKLMDTEGVFSAWVPPACSRFCNKARLHTVAG